MRLALAQTNFKGDCRMNKKLMAVAVAGAFVTPALVFAQTATVQVYGKATVEYGYADQGDGRPNTDTFQTPGGSSVGFKGQEQLGGGMSAWFQCESSADVRGLNQDGFCGRNSAIGLKGGWGNVFFGRWDTPFKRSTIGMVGAGDTGLLGGAFLFVGNSTGTAASGGQGASVSLSRNVWKRRESSLLYYESPSFSGFTILGAFSAANATGATDATTNAKPRVASLAGMYSNGPLNIAAGYEKHYNFGNGATGAAAVARANGNASFPGQFVAGGPNALSSFTAPVTGSAATAGTGDDDRGWTIGANYNFMGNLLVGFQYIDMKYEMAAGTEVKKKNWFIGADWNVAGPHHVVGAYINAGDSKGNATSSPGATGNGGIAAPNVVVGGVTVANAGTGANLWELGYQYDFSKRTKVKFSYVKLNNDDAATYSLGGLATGVAGSNQSAWVMYGEHVW
jgi:predicted porin